MKSKETGIKTILIAVLICLLAFMTYFLIKGWADGHYSSIDTLRTYIASFGMWGPLVLTLIQAMQVVLPVLPGFMGCIVGAVLFGAAGGFWVNYIGISAGSIAAYWLARSFGIKLVDKMIRMEKYDSYIRRLEQSKSYSAVLFLAILLPLAPDDFLCYFSGLIQMSSRKFTTIILLGKPWCILFYCIFFAYFL